MRIINRADAIVSMRRVHIRNLLRYLLRGGVAAACAAMSITLFNGCSEGGTRSAQLGQTEFSIHPSATKIVAGELVTVTVKSANTLGREAEVRWETTGGELTTEQRGMVARVHFDQPGRYVVTSRLYLDGDLVQRDSTNIEVVPLTRGDERPIHDESRYNDMR